MTGKNILERFNAQPWWVQWILTGLLAVVLFAPLLTNSFVNDDHIVLKKVVLEKKLNVEGFFRPLSDLLIMMNGWLGGLNPVGYYILQILLHATNTLLLFHFCRQWKWSTDPYKQLLFAVVAALFFLTYPFHSESVAWILGRASLIASTFGILALTILVSSWKEPWKLTGVSVAYFIGMAGYETLMVLPGIVLIWLLSVQAGRGRIARWMGVLGLTLAFHFVVRNQVSGMVVNNYGEGFLQVDFPVILGNIVKVSGRLFLPPINNGMQFLILLVLLCLFLIVALSWFWKSIRTHKPSILYFFQLSAMLLVALLLPFLFGVSTHTSESERFLYFPSFFFCTLIAFIVINLFYQRRALPIVVLLITGYHIYFLQTTLQHWRKASGAVTEILSIVRAHTGPGKLYIVNMPDEIEGAFVFRTGFPEALRVYNIDASHVTVINHTSRNSLVSIPDPLIHHQVEGTKISIPPTVKVEHGDATGYNEEQQTLRISAGDKVVYWNKEQWVRL